MASPLFNDPVKCRKCGREFRASEAEGHACTPLWLQGLVKGGFKALATFSFAVLVGIGFGIGFTLGLSAKPPLFGAVVHRACDDVPE